jgi:hypothetical protein
MSPATEADRLLFVNLCPIFSRLVRHPLQMGVCLARADALRTELQPVPAWGLHITGIARLERVIVLGSRALGLSS